MAAMNKRKRESQDIAAARPAPGTSQTGNEFEQHYLTGEEDTAGNAESGMDFSTEFTATDNSTTEASKKGQSASDTAAAAMAQYHTMTVPQSTESSFINHDTNAGLNAAIADSLSGRTPSSNLVDYEVGPGPADSSPNGDTSPTAGPHSTLLGPPKPTVGSEEWHKVRKDNHKEVERRRRETINEGINELAKIVPGCEKNKGSILVRAVQFITQLKENETQNIEKWTLEKLLTEQAIAELSSSCDKLKEECTRAWTECEQWKTAAQKAGVTSIKGTAKGDDDADDAE